MKKSELRQMIKEEINKLQKHTIQEYLVRQGDKIEDLMGLNLFEDGKDKLSNTREFRSDPSWMNIERKYSKIASDLEKQLKPFFKQPIPLNIVRQLDSSWYDGSDAYDDPVMAIEHLPEIYDKQIRLITVLLRNIKK